MDLIRSIMLFAETGEEQTSGSTKDEIAYHVWLLKEAGYLEASIHNNAKGVPDAWHIFALTWEGHEFLDAMRDDTLWKKAKANFIKPGASFTAKLIYEWLKLEVKQRMLGGHDDGTPA